MWIGAFWRYDVGEFEIWICLLPCFPLHLHWRWDYWTAELRCCFWNNIYDRCDRFVPLEDEERLWID